MAKKTKKTVKKALIKKTKIEAGTENLKVRQIKGSRFTRYKPSGQGKLNVPPGGWFAKYIGYSDSLVERSPVEDKDYARDMAEVYIVACGTRDYLTARMEEGIASADEIARMGSVLTTAVRIMTKLRLGEKLLGDGDDGW